MKRKVQLTGLVVLALFFLGGCAGLQTTKTPQQVFVDTSYKTLATAQITYDFMWGAFVKLYNKKEVTQEKFDEGMKIATYVYDAIQEGHRGMTKYFSGEFSQMDAEKALKLLDKALAKLEKYLEEESGGKVRKPLIH